MIVVVLVLIVANVVFAIRSLDVILRSSARIEPREPDPSLPSLSVIVPARNEAERIERCIRSLLAANYPDFEVVAIDDCSEDATRAVLDGIAAQSPRLHVVGGAPLPPGWVGKPWALAQGARAARGDWLLFTDADTAHEALGASSAMRYALENGCDVLSLLTDQETVTLAERTLLPTILFVILLGIGPLEDINDPRKRDVAIFNGQYVLASRHAYEAIGGHAAVRDEIAEDLELARRFKSDGRYRIALVGASGLVRTRMYRSFAEIWRGFVKNFATGARGRPLRAAAGVALLACVALSPVAALGLFARQAWLPAFAVALAVACIVAIAEAGMRRSRFRPGTGLGVHLGLATVLAIFATSLFCTFIGSGVEWRGRRYGGGFSKRG
ncbi:MAG: glycosyltransferase [Candidatus Eremiobacteraeota bacterium]|nr:glycosyltransferase [Candidatus Eremiobacteraeota bacterium]MBV8497763.1 glycosyltransferase [Candidatus Eremiobacteraeota bacterium]